MESLFEKKGELREVERDELDTIRLKHPELRSLPAKLVITRKAGGKRKTRIVVCGNYAEKSFEEELYAGGSDSISMRTALRMAVQEGWSGVTADVRTAFLNAPLPAGAHHPAEAVGEVGLRELFSAVDGGEGHVRPEAVSKGLE